MELYKRKKFDFQVSDSRGMLIQLCDKCCSQVNILISKTGVCRGNHYHKISRESFYVVTGKVNVFLKNKEKSKNVTFESGDYFEIEPLTIHSMDFEQDTTMVVMYDVPIVNSKGEKDIFAEEL